MDKTAQPKPFSCKVSSDFASILWEKGITIVISTYQAGKVIFLSATGPDKVVQLPRSFNRAMGLSFDGRKLAIATKDEVHVLANSPTLAPTYPRSPNTYDGMFAPRATYYTGIVDIHDVEWGKEDQLWAVSTSFSCIARINQNFSFQPEWQPPFITKLSSEDRCHLNGMAMKEGVPAFATALGSGDTAGSWRENITSGGILMEVPSGKILSEGLAMPHSPRFHDGYLYYLQSASGKIMRYNPENGNEDTLYQSSEFLRGLAIHDDLMIIGRSQPRKTSKTFEKLKNTNNDQPAGVTILDLKSCKILARIDYMTTVEEIYDVKVLPGLRRPGIMAPGQEVHREALVLPEATFWARKNES